MKSTGLIGIVVFLASAMALGQNPVSITDRPIVDWPTIDRPVPNSKNPSALLQPDPAIRGKIVENYGKLPLSFEANQGQADPNVKFLSRGTGYTLFLTSDEAVFSLRGSKLKGNAPGAHRLPPLTASATDAVVRMKLLHANPVAKVTGAEELPGKSNYFIGNNPKKWQSNVPTFAKVTYQGIYPGIDLVYYGNQRQLEYDFVVAPGANPRRIQFDVRGAKTISQDKDGDLVLQMGEGEVRWHKLVVYQEKDGARQEIPAHYVIKSKKRVEFRVADYDLRRTLFIDPLLYSTYLGGSPDNLGGNGDDLGFGIAVDSAGNAYVTGETNSTNFPTMNSLQTAKSGGYGIYNAFVAVLNPTGSALIYSTYLGGSGGDSGGGIAVDSSGNAYVTGSTGSTDFPTKNPLQPAYGGGLDAFVAVLNPTGSALVYSTYLGGSGDDGGSGIAVDSAGNAYVTGLTTSTNFPTMNPLQPANGGSYDAFVAKLNSLGSALVYSTYLGGSGDEYGYGIAVDGAGNAYVTGSTDSTNFPTMNPLQPANGSSYDAFVAMFNPSGSALVYSTYLGGEFDDRGRGIAVDSAGNAYITGNTDSTNYPTMNPLQATNGGGSDAFVSEIGAVTVTLTPSSLNFGNQNVDTSSTAQNITLANIGTGALNIGSIVTTGDFSQTTTCPNGGSLAAGSNCTISITFTPTAYGTRSGAVTITDNGPGCPQTIPLTGVGVAPLVMLSPSNINFGNQTVGVASSGLIATLTNTGNSTLSITSITVTGSNSSDFVQTNACGSSLAAGANCNIGVTFDPSATGARTAAVSVTDSAAGSPQSLPLTGVGLGPLTLSPTTITFPAQYVGTSGLNQNVTLTNTGTSPLTITSVTASPADFSQLSTCGNSVAAGASCEIGVFFDPTTSGTRTGTLTITDSAVGSPQTVALTGAGQDFSISPSGSSTATVSPGQTATYSLVIAPSGGFNQAVSFTCSGAPAGSTCTVPSSVTLNGSTSTTVPVTVTTAATSASLSHPRGSSPTGSWLAMWLTLGGLPAGLVILGASGRRRSERRWLYRFALLCIFAFGLALTGCGGGSNPGGGGKSTSYNLTVTGTFSSGTTKLTHNTALTLVVQ